MKELEIRLQSKISMSNNCWQWIGAIQGDGYGTAWDKRIKKGCLAHRLIYELLVGPIPIGLTLDHLCRNRSCVNPAHLEPVCMKVNMLRGISPAANKARQTLCIRGHELDVLKNGWRICRICVKDYKRRPDIIERERQRNKEWRENHKEYDRERKRIWRLKYAGSRG